jgi:hypothetical protein
MGKMMLAWMAHVYNVLTSQIWEPADLGLTTIRTKHLSWEKMEFLHTVEARLIQSLHHP